MSTSILVALDGTVHDATQPYLYVDDHAAVRGDGVFETLLVRDGRACSVSLHLRRLVRSARLLDLAEPDTDAWRSAIDVATRAWVTAAGADAEGVLRLVYSRGRESVEGAGTGFLTVGPVADRVSRARTRGVSVLVLDRGHSVDLAAAAPWQLLGAKTLSYATNMAALRHAASLGYDDVIYVSSEGVVLEGPRSSVVVVRDGTLITPPAEIGVLAGTTQLATFALAESEGRATRTQVLRRADLIAADSVWLLSSVTLAARVTAIDGYALPASADADWFTDLVDRAISADR
ncbi:MAG: aminodeoxychorismate lyase [Gordonia sp. (in: high G+C Gram-positive bacteria)]